MGIDRHFWDPSRPQREDGSSARRRSHRPMDECEFHRLFLYDHGVAWCDHVSRDDRFAAMYRLGSRIEQPEKVRAQLAEPFRNGGPDLWARCIVHQFLLDCPLTGTEFAKSILCDVSSIRRAIKLGPHIESKSLKVVFSMLQVLAAAGYGVYPLPRFPGGRQETVAGLCAAAPRLYEALRRRRGLKRGDCEPIAYKSGLFLDVFVAHRNARLAYELLPVLQPTACELRRHCDLMEVLEECAGEVNWLLAKHPQLMSIEREFVLDDELETIGKNLILSEAWFLSRELLLHDRLSGACGLLGIFV